MGDQLDKDDCEGNCRLAFHVAYAKLGIPPLLDVEDVVNHEIPDQKSIMTYLAQFYHKFEQILQVQIQVSSL